MSRNYTKVECLAGEVFRRKSDGETNREIEECFGLSKKQVKELTTHVVVFAFSAEEKVTV